MDKMENFKQAFDEGVGSCRATCECGHVFYDIENNDWDWAEGEFKELESDPDATPLNYAIPRICFEGTEYVPECNCWKERAKKIMAFLDSHAHQIAKYLTLEKERKTIEAKVSPVVK